MGLAWVALCTPLILRHATADGRLSHGAGVGQVQQVFRRADRPTVALAPAQLSCLGSVLFVRLAHLHLCIPERLL